VAVTDAVEVPEVAFTGDTSADWIARGASGEDRVAADALRAKLLMCECTFVDDAVDPAGAREYGHTHVDEIAAAADAFENQAVLLMHFSARYKARDVEEQLDARLPRGLRERVTPLLVGYG
jgi:ribonuclease Z